MPWALQDDAGSCPQDFEPPSLSGLDGGCLAPTWCDPPDPFCVDFAAAGCDDDAGVCFGIETCPDNSLINHDVGCACPV
jgi:hypothetical protein